MPWRQRFGLGRWERWRWSRSSIRCGRSLLTSLRRARSSFPGWPFDGLVGLVWRGRQRRGRGGPWRKPCWIEMAVVVRDQEYDGYLVVVGDVWICSYVEYAPVEKPPLILSSGALCHAGRHEVFYDASVPSGYLAAWGVSWCTPARRRRPASLEPPILFDDRSLWWLGCAVETLQNVTSIIRQWRKYEAVNGPEGCNLVAYFWD